MPDQQKVMREDYDKVKDKYLFLKVVCWGFGIFLLFAIGLAFFLVKSGVLSIKLHTSSTRTSEQLGPPKLPKSKVPYNCKETSSSNKSFTCTFKRPFEPKDSKNSTELVQKVLDSIREKPLETAVIESHTLTVTVKKDFNDSNLWTSDELQKPVLTEIDEWFVAHPLK